MGTGGPRRGENRGPDSQDSVDPIADENRELIFDAYQRGDAPAGMNHSLGLGLHISRTLARRMGGDLTYGQADGTSTFELTLPLAKPAAG